MIAVEKKHKENTLEKGSEWNSHRYNRGQRPFTQELTNTFIPSQKSHEQPEKKLTFSEVVARHLQSTVQNR